MIRSVRILVYAAVFAFYNIIGPFIFRVIRSIDLVYKMKLKIMVEKCGWQICVVSLAIGHDQRIFRKVLPACGSCKSKKPKQKK